ncbi:Vacuolar protein sorting-associated protein 8 like protein [Chelonia mydas]|uniref:Vacuolar protein sorting-associated protein 8 like protein n=1 Tax=Chelonia mydas TaxID=8469 RepID=M7CD35_CHEMY|nr:Vacuolar protein sorting-associated protein 8 like protein [Chelonia mydas]
MAPLLPGAETSGNGPAPILFPSAGVAPEVGEEWISDSGTHPFGAGKWGMSQGGAPIAKNFGAGTVDFGPERGMVESGAVGLLHEPDPGRRTVPQPSHSRHCHPGPRLRTWRRGLDTLSRTGTVCSCDDDEELERGLSGDANKRKSVLADRMVEILFHYADRTLKKCPDQGKIQVMEQHFQDMVPVIVDYCLLLQRTDLLFSQMYDKLSENSVAKGVFLECLEPYILSDKLMGMTAQVMKDLLLHYQDKNLMEDMEACIVHMDITSLDIQQVVLLCWENHLYDAMIYVYNSGMNDFISPMEKGKPIMAADRKRDPVWEYFNEVPLPVGKTGMRAKCKQCNKEMQGLVTQMKQQHEKCSFSGGSCVEDDERNMSERAGPLDEKVVMGNKLLVYISCCLAGRAYPLGDIPEDLVPLVKNQVFEFLIRLHSAEASADEEVYPYVRTLLHFDTREFLNVLALTFEDFKNDKQAVEYQQRIVDILLKVMVENSDFTPSQVGCLFTFLARQLAKPNNTLFVNRTLFDQVLLELLQAGGIVQFEENRLIPMAEKAEFYQICEFMYEREHLYDKIIDCYLRDPVRKEEVFNYIHNILSIPGYSAEEKQSVWQKAMKHIEELLLLSPNKAADLIATHFNDQIEGIIKNLQANTAVTLKPLVPGAPFQPSILTAYYRYSSVVPPYHGDSSVVPNERMALHKLWYPGDLMIGKEPQSPLLGTRTPVSSTSRHPESLLALGYILPIPQSAPPLRSEESDTGQEEIIFLALIVAHCHTTRVPPNSIKLTYNHSTGPLREGINQDMLQISPCVTEQFIELLCHYSPDHVLETLQVLEFYRLEETIQITQKHLLHEASSYLLEKKGDVHGAFLVMLEQLRSKLLMLTCEIEESTELHLLKDIEDTLVKTIALCQRNSHSLNQQQREALWFPLLEAMMSPQKLSSSTVLCQYSELLRQLFHNAPGRAMDQLRNVDIYKWITWEIQAKGYDRNQQQCRVKVKEFCQGCHKAEEANN